MARGGAPPRCPFAIYSQLVALSSFPHAAPRMSLPAPQRKAPGNRVTSSGPNGQIGPDAVVLPFLGIHLPQVRESKYH